MPCLPLSPPALPRAAPPPERRPSPRRIHPGPNGHQALAELLSGVLRRAAAEVAAGAEPARRDDPRLAGLPPPLAPTYEEDRSSLCVQLVGWKARCMGGLLTNRAAQIRHWLQARAAHPTADSPAHKPPPSPPPEPSNAGGLQGGGGAPAGLPVPPREAGAAQLGGAEVGLGRGGARRATAAEGRASQQFPCLHRFTADAGRRAARGRCCCISALEVVVTAAAPPHPVHAQARGWSWRWTLGRARAPACAAPPCSCPT
jgi:hypothetical protein